MMDQAEALRRLVNKTTEEKVKARIITVTSGKGGVGKSNFIVNLALTLCKEGKKVLLFDADIGMGNDDVLMGVYHKYNIMDVIDGKVSLDQARAQFIKANKVPPERLGNGIDINYLSFYNNLIDGLTREAVKQYLSKGILLDNVEIEGINPLEYSIRSSQLHHYIRCIDKTTVKSHHDFKGGYSLI